MKTISKTIGWKKNKIEAITAWSMIIVVFALVLLVFAFEVAINAAVFFAVVILAATLVIMSNRHNAKGSVLWAWIPAGIIILVLILLEGNI